MSPVALVLYGVLGVVLIHPLIKETGYGGISKYDLLTSLQLVIIVSVIVLIMCSVHDPYGYKEINTQILGLFGMYIFGLFLLLCLWGFKRADKVKDDLFENLSDGDELNKGLSPQFKKFAFSVYFVVSLVGFVVSANYEKWYNKQVDLREEYNYKLTVIKNKINQAISSENSTEEQYKAFSDSLSTYKERYEKTIEISHWSETDLQEMCEKLLVDMEKQVERNKKRSQRKMEINDEFASELQRFLSALPDKLTEEQYGEYNATLFNLYKIYYKSLTRYKDTEEFSAEVDQLYQHCKQELNNRSK